MKKNICIAAIAALGIAAGCTKEASDITPESGGGGGFSITVSAPATKTVFDPQTYAVTWEQDDELGVYIVGGSEAGLYKFTNVSGNTFSCPEFTPDAGTLYSYYVLYPYHEDFTVTDGKSNAVVNILSGQQILPGDAGHIKTPLFGVAQSSGAETPSVLLKHAASVIRINIENNSGSALSVSEVGLVSSDPDAIMSGTFSLNFITGSLTPYGTQNSSVTELPESKTIANGSSANFFVAVAPFAASDLSVTVNGDKLRKTSETGFDFREGCVYSTSVLYDEVPLSRTIEDPNVFAAITELDASRNYITVSVDGTKYYVCPESGEFRDGEPVPVTLSVVPGVRWIFTQPDSYRIVYDRTAESLTMYSSAHEFNNPKIIDFWYENNEGTGWYLSKTMSPGLYYIRTNTGWDSWAGKGYSFEASLADPYVLICSDKVSISIDKSNKQFNIKLGLYLSEFEILQEGTTGESPVDAKITPFSSKCYALIPADADPTTLLRDIEAGVWMPMTGAVDNDTRWHFPEDRIFDFGQIIIDLRNGRIRFDAVE